MTQGNTTFLTNNEIIAQLTLRDDLTALEHDLLDRLILATEEVARLDNHLTEIRHVRPSDNQPRLT